MPDEIIVREGLVGNSMYFIQRGQVRIIKSWRTPQEKFLGMLQHGSDTNSFFGEIAITSPDGALRTSSVISNTVLTLQRLTRAALEDVITANDAFLRNRRRSAVRVQRGEAHKYCGSEHHE